MGPIKIVSLTVLAAIIVDFSVLSHQLHRMRKDFGQERFLPETLLLFFNILIPSLLFIIAATFF